MKRYKILAEKIENIKKNQMKIVELKNTVAEKCFESIFLSLNSEFHMSQFKISGNTIM